MPLAEVVTIEVGTAIAKYILKLWLKDSSLGQGISLSLIDLLKAKTADRLAQREGNRQFEKIGEKVGSHLVPFFQQEGAQLGEGECTAVAYAVADTFGQSTLSTEVLLQHNLEPTHLAQYVFASHPLATRDLNQAATDLYRRIIKEACTCIVDIASQLPAFSERSIAEVLKREDLIVRKVDQILAELQKIQERLDPMIEAERFEIEYRQAVARNLDILQLIGADVSLPNRRHRLSVAYITLSVEQTWSELPLIREQFDKVAGIEVEDKAEEGDIVSVNTALAGSRRLLISGSPGSGKTTLLQWVAVRAATRSFDEELRDWNMVLPFYIRLRHYVQSALPRPEAFPIFAAPAIVDMMPRGWVHTVLKSGRALVLVDGVDEVPEAQREEMHTWLNDLVETYPHTYFLVTSRPHAIQAGWMSHHTFNKVELQPMERTDIL